MQNKTLKVSFNFTKMNKNPDKCNKSGKNLILEKVINNYSIFSCHVFLHEMMTSNTKKSIDTSVLISRIVTDMGINKIVYCINMGLMVKMEKAMFETW